jgi:hypothetical protein
MSVIEESDFYCLCPVDYLEGGGGGAMGSQDVQIVTSSVADPDPEPL